MPGRHLDTRVHFDRLRACFSRCSRSASAADGASWSVLRTIPFGAVMDLIIGIATLYLTLKIPAFLRSLGGPSAPNPLNDATGVAATALMAVRFATLAGA